MAFIKEIEVHDCQSATISEDGVHSLKVNHLDVNQ